MLVLLLVTCLCGRSEDFALEPIVDKGAKLSVKGSEYRVALNSLCWLDINGLTKLKSQLLNPTRNAFYIAYARIDILKDSPDIKEILLTGYAGNEKDADVTNTYIETTLRIEKEVNGIFITQKVVLKDSSQPVEDLTLSNYHHPIESASFRTSDPPGVKMQFPLHPKWLCAGKALLWVYIQSEKSSNGLGIVSLPPNSFYASGGTTNYLVWNRKLSVQERIGRSTNQTIYLANRMLVTVTDSAENLAKTAQAIRGKLQPQSSSENDTRTCTLDGYVRATFNSSQISLCKNAPNIMELIYWSAEKCAKPRIIMDLPGWIEFEGACYGGGAWYGARPETLAGSIPCEKEPIKKDGQDYYRYTLSLSERIAQKPNVGHRTSWALFFLTPKEQKAGQCYWHLETEKGIGMEKAFSIKTTPAIKHLLRPKDFICGLFLGYALDIPDETSRNKLMAFYNLLNIDNVVASRRQSADLQKKMAENRIKTMRLTWGVGGRLRDSSGGTVSNEMQVYDADGNTKINTGPCCPVYVCPLWMVREGRGQALASYKEMLLSQANVTNDAYILYDYELQNIMTFCFCKRCIGYFADKTGITEKDLNPQIILSRHRMQWLEFKEWLMAEEVRLYAEACRAVAPDAKVVLCITEYFDDLARRENYGNFLPLCESSIDIAIPMLYFHGERFYKTVENMTRRCKASVIPYISLGTVHGRVGDPRDVKLEMVASARSGTKGCFLYPGASELYGEYLNALDDALAVVAVLEEYLKNGRRDDTFKMLVQSNDGKEYPYDYASVYKSGEKYCILIFNYTNKELSIKLTSNILNGNYCMANPAEETLIVAEKGMPSWTGNKLSQGITVRLQPRDVIVLTIEPWQKGDRADYQTIKLAPDNSASREPPFKPIADQGLNVRADDINQDGAAEILIESSAQKIWISPDLGARIISWKIADSEKQLVATNSYSGGLCEDLFWVPKEAQRCGDECGPYVITDCNIENNNAIVRLERKLEKDGLSGLKLSKTFKFPRQATSFEVTWQITNGKETSQNISFWCRNIPSLAVSELSKKGVALVEGVKWIIPKKDGLEAIGRPLNGINVFHKAEDLKEGWLMVYCPLTKEALMVDFEKDQLLQTYSYRGDPSTMEWMYKEVTLPPGETWQSTIKLSYIQNMLLSNLGDMNDKVGGNETK